MTADGRGAPPAVVAAQLTRTNRVAFDQAAETPQRPRAWERPNEVESGLGELRLDVLRPPALEARPAEWSTAKAGTARPHAGGARRRPAPQRRDGETRGAGP